MLSVLRVTFPFFALVLCGYLAAWRGVLPHAAIPGLNAFVLYFALPCMLYRFGAQTPAARLFDGAAALVWLLCALAMTGAALLAARGIAGRPRMDWNNAAFGALAAAFPNTGFMGVPLLTALLGPAAAGPVIVTIVIDMAATTSLCIALSRLDAAGTHGAGVAARGALRGVLVNPLPWAIGLGAAVSAFALPVPAPLTQTAGMLADAASPAALFTIGAVLARARAGAGTAAPPRDAVPLALAKLLLHPLLVWGAGHAARALGLPLASATLAVLVLVAALPSASNVAMLAERFGADNGRIARVILISTALAFLSFAAAVALLR